MIKKNKIKSASISDSPKRQEYFEAVGRRKTSIARVRLFPVSSKTEHSILVNDKQMKVYFPSMELQNIIEEPLKISGKFRISAKIKGGGIHSQAEAMCHGISRALIKFNPELRKNLKKAEFLKRDPRMKERRKFGLKKARKAPQWSKR